MPLPGPEVPERLDLAATSGHSGFRSLSGCSHKVDDILRSGIADRSVLGPPSAPAALDGDAPPESNIRWFLVTAHGTAYSHEQYLAFP